MKIKLKLCCKCNLPKVIWRSIGKDKWCKECYGKSLTGVAKKPKPTAARIPVMSSKRQKLERIYSVIRVKFLNDHPNCMLHHPGICLQKATEVHHTAGRIEELFLDTRFWKSACRPCHHWAENHPEEAKILGYSTDRLTKPGENEEKEEK